MRRRILQGVELLVELGVFTTTSRAARRDGGTGGDSKTSNGPLEHFRREDVLKHAGLAAACAA